MDGKKAVALEKALLAVNVSPSSQTVLRGGRQLYSTLFPACNTIRAEPLTL